MTPREQVSALNQLVTFPALSWFFCASYADMARMERRLPEIDTDWTVLRPPRFTNGPATGD